MKIAYIWPRSRHDALGHDYWLTNTDGHFATFAYLARYYTVQILAGASVPLDTMRDAYAIRLRPDWSQRLELLCDLAPDVVVCYGPLIEDWHEVRELCPQAVVALDYGGGPLTDFNGNVSAAAGQFDWIFTAHETQASLLRAGGAKASKARGVPTNVYMPMTIPKIWHIFCPTTFAAGKRPALAAQYCEQYAPKLPSLFCGFMEHPAVVDMTRSGGIPLNKVGPVSRNGIQFGGRIPYPLMPLTYSASEIVVCASQEEAGPYVPMEAMACGVPTIVCTDMEWRAAEAFKELAEIFQGGIHVVDPSPEAIHQAVNTIMADYKRESLAARAAVLARYDWWPMYREIDQRLKNLVAFKQGGQEAVP